MHPSPLSSFSSSLLLILPDISLMQDVHGDPKGPLSPVLGNAIAPLVSYALCFRAAEHLDSKTGVDQRLSPSSILIHDACISPVLQG